MIFSISIFDKKQQRDTLRSMIKILRQIILVIWIFSVISLAYYISQHREYLEPARLLTFFQSFGSAALIIYILASFIRGIVLLPSLPLVLV